MQRKKLLAILVVLTMTVASTQTVQAAVKVPQEVVELSEGLGNQYDICPELIQAICFKESSFQTDAVSENCVGIMQVNPSCHRDRMDRLGVSDLYDLRSNMMVGVDYLAELIGRYEDVSVALMVYNGDSSAKDVLSGSDYISDYADQILTISEELERENGK